MRRSAPSSRTWASTGALARAFIVVPRTAGLFAHAFEESVREPGWRQITLDQVEYDGPALRIHDSGAAQ